MKVRVSLTREIELTEEDFELLKEFIEEGNGQGFNEMTEIELGDMKAEKIDEV